MFELGKRSRSAAEIGSFKGLSAAIVGLGMRESNGKYYCIDTFEALSLSEQHRVNGGTWEAFESMVTSFQLSDIIVPIRGYSYETTVLTQVPNDLDFVYIDGAHDAESVIQDTVLYVPKVKKDGLVLYHDYPWASVKAGIKQAENLNLVRLIEVIDDFAIYSRIL
jgi:predicted O-methyltransferase YrrM